MLVKLGNAPFQNFQPLIFKISVIFIAFPLEIDQKFLQKIHPARYPTVPELKLQHGLIKGYIGQVVGEAETFI